MEEVKNTFGPELFAALVAAQGEFKNPIKTRSAKVTMKSGGTYSYLYADLSDIMDMNRPVLSKHGLAMMHINRPDGLTARLVHVSGEYIDSLYEVPGGMAPQELGGWFTYMRKYSTCNMLFIASETDDDGATAESAHRSQSEAEVEAKKAALREGLKKAATDGRLTNAHTGKPIKPEELDKKLATEPEHKDPVVNMDPDGQGEPTPEDSEDNDLSMVNAKLAKVMGADGITKKQLRDYYTAAGHFGADSPAVEDITDEYVDQVLANWKKVKSAIQKGTK